MVFCLQWLVSTVTAPRNVQENMSASAFRVWTTLMTLGRAWWWHLQAWCRAVCPENFLKAGAQTRGTASSLLVTAWRGRSPRCFSSPRPDTEAYSQLRMCPNLCVCVCCSTSCRSLMRSRPCRVRSWHWRCRWTTSPSLLTQIISKPASSSELSSLLMW